MRLYVALHRSPVVLMEFPYLKLYLESLLASHLCLAQLSSKFFQVPGQSLFHGVLLYERAPRVPADIEQMHQVVFGTDTIFAATQLRIVGVFVVCHDLPALHAALHTA